LSFSRESKLNILNGKMEEGECAIAFLSGLFHSNGELSMSGGKWQGNIVTEIPELFEYVDEIVKRLYGDNLSLQIEDNYVINKTTYYSIILPSTIAERVLADCGIIKMGEGGYEIDFEINENVVCEESTKIAFIKGAYASMIKKEKFMHFWITFSNHPDYTLNKKECSIHYDKIKSLFPDEKSDIKLCGYAQAYEMDNAFKILIDNLKKDNLLKDTVIIAYSDHPNGEYYGETESKKKNYTQMFIYNPELEHKEINVLTNTINILPMINNLFALNSPYYMASYDPLLEKNSYLLFDDLSIYENGNYKQIDQERLKSVEMSKNLLISDYYNKK